MNSLNILSARVSPPQTPSPSRTNSYGNLSTTGEASGSRRDSRDDILDEKAGGIGNVEGTNFNPEPSAYEETPLLSKEHDEISEPKVTSWYLSPTRISAAVIESIRWVLSAFAAPGVYLIAYLYDERGYFAPISQLKKLSGVISGSSRQSSTGQAVGLSAHGDRNSLGEQSNGKITTGRRTSVRGSRILSSNSSSSGLSSESESDFDRASGGDQSLSTGSNRHTRSKSLQPSDEIAPARRSIRIKLHNEDSLRQRKHRRAQSSNQNSSSGTPSTGELSAASIKSPTSPSASLLMTKYPRTPAPPRPLIPRRQPSYVLPEPPSGRLIQKTLILDLDETLIHSMAKGGRMSTGHMVEVKLNTVVGPSGNATSGPQHPILYYVHKRPHCDDFLRRVCKWYNLVVFTASVQEYADPVIDWLEQERKFFSGRYYRQHCTFRHGAFIKDLSSVEPDLSKVMILDNSPLSYMFHQDNAIPIEGWISDPTDNDLLHLVPLLEGLQWVTDVRAFLGLRGGEDGKQ